MKGRPEKCVAAFLGDGEVVSEFRVDKADLDIATLHPAFPAFTSTKLVARSPPYSGKSKNQNRMAFLFYVPAGVDCPWNWLGFASVSPITASRIN